MRSVRYISPLPPDPVGTRRGSPLPPDPLVMAVSESPLPPDSDQVPDSRGDQRSDGGESATAR